MKKSFVLFIVLLTLAIAVVYMGHTSVLAEKDQVQITEHVLYGDKSLVEGVTLEMHATYEDQLFWDTTYQIGEMPKVSTDYEFCQSRQSRYNYTYEGSINFYEDTVEHFGWNSHEENLSQISAEKLDGLELAVKELYDSLEPNEVGECMISLKDYVDYYHFEVEIDNPPDTEYGSFSFVMRENELEGELAQGRQLEQDTEIIEKQLEWLRYFQEYFKIPVLENEVAKIAMKKDEEGLVTGWGMATVSSGSGTGDVAIPTFPESEVYDSFSMYIESVITDGDVYLTFDPHSFHGKIVDTSLIPGGYGIYHFPYDAEKREIYPEKLQTVYTLDPSVQVLDLTIDARRENLLLFTIEGKTMYMSVIDIATMTLEDKMVVGEESDEDILDMVDYVYSLGIENYALYEDYMVLNTFNELVLFTIDEEGNYKKEFAVYKAQIDTWILDETGMTTIAASDTAYDWNGEHLVMANYMFNLNGHYACDFYVAVVGEEGLLYFATYDSSLCSTNSKDLTGNEVYNYEHCHPLYEGGMFIRWK